MPVRFLFALAAFLAAGCGGGAERPEDPAAAARRILAGAQRQIGGEAAVAAVATLRAEARVRAPGREFVTVVWSARDGRARMEQREGFTAGIHPGGNWRLDDDGTVVPLEAVEVAAIRGHELHAAVLAPETRYRDPSFRGRTQFDAQDALEVSLTDVQGDRVYAYFAAADTLPLGFRLNRPDPDVLVTLGGWEPRGDVLLFTWAEFAQAGESFRYDYVDLSLDGVPDSVFAAPR